MKPSDFLEPCKIRHGSIHAVNLNRKFQSMLDKTYYEPNFILSKGRRLCLVLSITKTNIENALVIPIKTKGESNLYPYEFYMDICLKEGWECVLCISQLTLIPLNSIDTREIAAFNSKTMEKVYMLVDELIGRKNPVHLSDTNELTNFMKKIEPKGPTIFGFNDTKLAKIKQDPVSPMASGGGYQKCSNTIPSKPDVNNTKKENNDDKNCVEKITAIEKQMIKNYITDSYKKSSLTDRKFVSPIISELFSLSKKKYSEEEIATILKELGYNVKIGKTKRLYVSGMKRIEHAEVMDKPFDKNFLSKKTGDEIKLMKLDMLSMSEKEFAKKYGFSDKEMAIVNNKLTVHGKYGEISR